MDDETAVLQTIATVALLVFVIASMLAMGTGLRVSQIVDPLRARRLVVLALVANFVLVPLLALAIAEVISLEDDMRTGLLLMATAAGAPFLPKLAQVAKGDVAFAVGLMTLLMVVTIAYMPLVTPLLLTDVEINPWDIARSLIFMMLLPLCIGLFTKWRYEQLATRLEPLFANASTVAIGVLMVAGVISNFEAVIGFVGTGGIAAIIIFLLVSVGLSYPLGGSEAASRSVLGLGTGQRNLSAAMVVAGQNFSDSPNVLTFILVAGLLGLVLFMVLGAEMGRFAERAEATA